MRNRILFAVVLGLVLGATSALCSGQQLEFVLNPFSSNGPFGGVLAIVAAWVRKIIAWGIVVRFFIWVIGRFRQMAAAPFATAPFGDSIVTSVNSIKVLGSGGGIGYAAKVVVYLAIGATVLTLPLATMATMTTGLPWSELVEMFSGGPGAPSEGPSMLAQALWFADQVVPWKVLMAAPVWYFVVESVLFPSQIFWMMFMKFLPL